MTALFDVTRVPTVTSVPSVPSVNGLNGERPYLRGWLHAVAAPLAVLTGAVLVSAAGTVLLRLALAGFAVAACALFATSAAFHRGRWSPSMHGLLMRADYANIHLWIAASATALAVALAGDPAPQLRLVWAVALLGVGTTLVRPIASRWLRTGGYLLSGHLAMASMAAVVPGVDTSVTALIVAGCLAYGLGGVVYAARRPDPWPRWFGFHEVFHALTVLGFAAHGAAIWVAIRPV
ncbi:MAG: hemolysin III family protein [Austwickia sp.]|nr:hemolysin III family protein [Austwickia sp.]